MSYRAKPPAPWVEIPLDQDNGLGGLPLRPGTFIRIFGWNGQRYPRQILQVSTFEGQAYRSTRDSYPSTISLSSAQKLTPDSWWSTTQYGAPVDFSDVIEELMREALAFTKTGNFHVQPTVPEYWKLNDED